LETYNKYIDLHTHSTASDGTLSPRSLVNLAHEIGLSHLALTDHDTMDGIIEAYQTSKNSNLKLIPGVEMSCAYAKGEIHILGYMLNFSGNEDDLEPIIEDLRIFAKDRENRNIEILKRLNNDGYNISYEELKLGNENTKITRAHFATVLMNKGYVKDRAAAFNSILNDNSKYVPKKATCIDKVCSFFNKHDLFFSLAHPLQYKLSNKELEDLIIKLKSFGMSGLEVYHSTHHLGDSIKLKKLANKYNLYPTGGSDFHGDTKPGLKLGKGYGSLNIPENIILDILSSKYRY
jgi:hypothetical protein